MQEDLAVGVGEAAVDRVAAHHRDDVGILLGLIFPEDLAVVVEVERKDRVRERRMNIHHVADNQRRAFVTAQDAGRESPGRRELVDILGVDLLEFRVPRSGEIAGGHHPLVRVRGQFRQFVVCGGVPGREQGRDAKAACKQKFAHSFLPVGLLRLCEARVDAPCVNSRFAATLSVGTASDSVSRQDETSTAPLRASRLVSEKRAEAPVPRHPCSRSQREDMPIKFLAQAKNSTIVAIAS